MMSGGAIVRVFARASTGHVISRRMYHSCNKKNYFWRQHLNMLSLPSVFCLQIPPEWMMPNLLLSPVII